MAESANMDKESVPEKENLSPGADTEDAPPNNYIYGMNDAVFVIFGIVTLLLDWGFDIHRAYKHWQHGDIFWFSLTVVFICLPSLVMTGFSLYWYVRDADNTNVPKASMSRWAVRILFHILQLGLLLRYLDSLYYVLISRRHWKKGERNLQIEYYTYMLYEVGDSVFLRLFECFMESAPQLVLQLYILSLERESEYGSNWFYSLWIGCFISLISLALGMTAFARGSRFTSVEKPNLPLINSCVLMLWHLFSISARVTAMVLFASVFGSFLFLFCGVHLLMTMMWLMVRRSLKEMCNSFLGEIGLSLIFGFIYIFVFINEKEEDTKLKYIFFYTIFGIENTIMVVVFLIYANTTVWYYIPGVVFHVSAFILSLILMGIYYSRFHPTLPSIFNLKRSQRRPEMDCKVEEEGEATAITSQTVM